MTNPVKNNSTSLFAFFASLFLLTLCITLFAGQWLLIIFPFVILFFYYGWQTLQPVFFLLLFSLPWSAEFKFNETLGTDMPDEPLMVFASLLSFANWLYKPSLISKRIWQHPLILFLLIHAGWIIVTVLFSSDAMVSFKFLLAKSWYVVAFVFSPFIIFKNKKTIRTAALVFLFSILGVTIIVLARQYATGFSFKHINEALTPFFRNHVNYSAMLVCSFPVLIACFQLNKGKFNLRFIILIAMLVVLAALLLSFARGGWLALIIGCFAYWLIRRKLLLKVFIAGVLVTIASVFWLKSNDRYLQFAHDYKTTIFHTDFREHLFATYQLKDVSTAERFYRWIAGIRMVKDNWLTGYGPATFSNSYKPYAIPAFKTWVSANKDHSTVHNYFLLTMIEQGVPGLIFFLLLTGAMLFYVQHLYYRINDAFYKMVSITTGAILTMIITVNFLSDLIETDKIGSLFFLCLSVLVVIDINTRYNGEINSNFY
ncbi:MAG: O-antigen ligase family protein [Bacteroidota bacterium]|nr:O-antigen ligase family protein [Bacteroidota bacterium]